MKKRKFEKLIVSLLLVAVLAAFGYYGSETVKEKTFNLQKSGTIVVNFLDVGQGDSEFIQLPNGKCMLIDAGTADSGRVIANHISKLGYTKIDYLVATHPHADHIGGMKEVVESFDIGEVYMPRASTNTKTYENLLLAISDKGLGINTAKAGKVIFSDNEITAEFLAPVNDNYDDLNNYSAVVRLEYGNHSFLFMGDAEELVEQEIINNASAEKLKANVLKAGHHGSSTSSSATFLNSVSPEYAVIEVGTDNKYNHPHSETINKLNSMGAEILRTDINGNIYIISDKSSFEIVCEKD